MRMRLLGRSGLRVSELCLGVSNFCATGLYQKSGDIGQEEADRIVAAALDGGINSFNVAEIYSDGNAEISLGKALGKRRHEAIVITKVHRRGCRGEITVIRGSTSSRGAKPA